MEIIWDDAKAEKNWKKHGISFEEAATVLVDPLAVTYQDEDRDEEHFITIGHSSLQNVLLVVWCERNKDLIRIISSRKVTPKERRSYEEGI